MENVVSQDNKNVPAQREQWETPDYYRIDADEAQTQVLAGPEILVLLS